MSVIKNLHHTFENLQKNEFYQKVDIIHLHNIHYDFFDFNDLIKIAKQKHIVWTLHDMWAITGGEAHTFDSENYKKGIGKTPYGAFHPLLNPIIDRRQSYLEQKKHIYSTINQLKGSEKHNFVFVPVSNWLATCLEQSFVYPKQIESKESKNTISIQTIQNGIDTTVFKNLNRRNWNTKRILFFNSDNPYKGAALFENIIPQLNQTTDFELIIVGKELSKNTLNSIPTTKVTHLKPIYDREKMNELYNSVDILVFPSRAENFSLLILEAMATGIFVLGSTAGGIKEQLAANKDEKTRGLLFENENQKDLLDKMDLVLNMPLKELREKGNTASLFVKENWNVEKMRAKYVELYKKILFSNSI